MPVVTRSQAKQAKTEKKEEPTIQVNKKKEKKQPIEKKEQVAKKGEDEEPPTIHLTINEIIKQPNFNANLLKQKPKEEKPKEKDEVKQQTDADWAEERIKIRRQMIEQETKFIQELKTLLNYDNSGSLEYKMESATKVFEYVNKHFVSIMLPNAPRFHRFMAVIYNKTTELKTEFETNRYNNHLPRSRLDACINSVTMTRSCLANYFHSSLMDMTREHPEFKDAEFLKAIENVATEFAKNSSPEETAAATAFVRFIGTTSKWQIELKKDRYKEIYRHCNGRNIQLFQKLYSIYKPMIQIPEIIALLEACETEYREGKEQNLQQFIVNTYLEKLNATQWGAYLHAVLLHI